MNWIFSIKNMDAAIKFYHEQGFVGFSDALTREDGIALQNAYEEAVKKGDIIVDAEKLVDGNDAIYRHSLFEKYLNDQRIKNVAENIFNQRDGLVLQHSKLNSKPLQDKGQGLIEWHQDYPFFPHTNFDLAAIGIHFDDEDDNSGSMKVIPGSHKWGVLSHCDENRKFVYMCTDKKYESSDSVLLTCPAGTVTVHHCLTLHQSSPKKNDKQRRFLVYQVRTDDNVQLGGVLWKCTGYQITGPSKRKGTVRFINGISVENRGVDGRLYDKYASLAPNK